MTRGKVTTIVLSCAALLFTNCWFTAPWRDAVAATDTQSNPAQSNAKQLPSINSEAKVWVCPMHPEIVQDHPGTCPICGMDLVEHHSGSGNISAGVHVDHATLQKLGVRLAKVERTSVTRDIRSYGTTVADGSAQYNIHSFFDGVIKKSYIHTVGQRVRQGQVIYEIYSPELNRQQQEYLKFVSRRNQILKSITGDALIFENEYVMDLLEELSQERTKFLREDIGIETVQQLEDHKRVIEVVPILAAASGVVTQINARAGDNVMPSTTLFALADPGRVWVVAGLYPDQADQVQVGDAVTITAPGKQAINARLDFLSPVAEGNRVSARITLDNAQAHLRPGSYVDVSIHAQSHTGLHVPSSAVLRSGQGNVVMLHRGDGHFLPVYVDIGEDNGDQVEITDGLQPGVEVAVNGQFLLDAAASLNAAIERMHGHAHDVKEMHDAK